MTQFYQNCVFFSAKILSKFIPFFFLLILFYQLFSFIKPAFSLFNIIIFHVLLYSIFDRFLFSLSFLASKRVNSIHIHFKFDSTPFSILFFFLSLYFAEIILSFVTYLIITFYVAFILLSLNVTNYYIIRHYYHFHRFLFLFTLSLQL